MLKIWPMAEDSKRELRKGEQKIPTNRWEPNLKGFKLIN